MAKFTWRIFQHNLWAKRLLLCLCLVEFLLLIGAINSIRLYNMMLPVVVFIPLLLMAFVFAYNKTISIEGGILTIAHRLGRFTIYRENRLDIENMTNLILKKSNAYKNEYLMLYQEKIIAVWHLPSHMLVDDDGVVFVPDP